MALVVRDTTVTRKIGIGCTVSTAVFGFCVGFGTCAMRGPSVVRRITSEAFICLLLLRVGKACGAPMSGIARNAGRGGLRPAAETRRPRGPRYEGYNRICRRFGLRLLPSVRTPAPEPG